MICIKSQTDLIKQQMLCYKRQIQVQNMKQMMEWMQKCIWLDIKNDQQIVKMIMESIDWCVDGITYGMWLMLMILVVSHVMSRIKLMRQKGLKMSKESMAVITGGCMGMGQEMAIEIAKLYQCKIIIVDIRKDLFDKVKQKLQSFGAQVQCHYCDLSDKISVEQFIHSLNQKNRKIDLFIHNAGIHTPKKTLETTDQQFYLQYQINLISPIKIIKSTIQLLHGGHIAILASMVAIIPGGIDVSTYASTKAALYSFVNSFRQELLFEKHRNVTISMACPYMIRTGMFRGYKTRLDFLFKQLEPRYAAKRLVKQFIKKKPVCYVYQYEGFLFKIVNLFPSELWDLFSLYFNVSNFQSIRNKHDSQIKKVS